MFLPEAQRIEFIVFSRFANTRGTLAALTLLGLAALPQAAQATITTFTNRASFLAALQPGFFNDDFAGVTNGGIQGASATRSGNGFSVTYTAPPSGLFSIAGAMSTNDATNNLVATVSSSPAQVFAFGADFFLTDSGGNFQPFVGNSVSAFASNGVDADSPLAAGVNSVTNFFGWISTTPLVSVTANAGGLTPNRWNTMDNVVVGVAASSAAPEPGTLALLTLGIAGGIAIKRRK
ncbi:PEP-CTERM sorting domain-containing protein [Armatimonas sp.]|uniref:PEP-CTERM sorting domain-containing protein n=1 Tax=Armatimonas sp. TaxID=1872638 RepID=UPI0037526234